jgi:hypothetical protein
MLLPSNTSTNKLASPTNVEGAEAGRMITVAANTSATEDYQKNFALVTSLILSNRLATNLAVSGKIVNGSTSAVFLPAVNIPPNTSFDVIQGNKFTLKEGDIMYLWHNSPTANAMGAILSYTLHRPLSTYDI